MSRDVWSIERQMWLQHTSPTRERGLRVNRNVSPRLRVGLVLKCIIGLWLNGSTLIAQDWPKLPEKDSTVEIPAQEWPQRPGPRTVRVLVHFPGG